MRKLGRDMLKLLIGNNFGTFYHMTLTFDLVIANSIGFYFCYPGGMSGPSVKEVGQSVLELLNGNDFTIFDPGDLDL